MSVTNKDIYEAVNNLERKLLHRIERIENEVKDNTNWRNKITGQITLIVMAVGFAVNFIWDFIIRRINGR
jgi:hypothetical protein